MNKKAFGLLTLSREYAKQGEHVGQTSLTWGAFTVLLRLSHCIVVVIIFSFWELPWRVAFTSMR